MGSLLLYFLIFFYFCVVLGFFFFLSRFFNFGVEKYSLNYCVSFLFFCFPSGVIIFCCFFGFYNFLFLFFKFWAKLQWFLDNLHFFIFSPDFLLGFLAFLFFKSLIQNAVGSYLLIFFFLSVFLLVNVGEQRVFFFVL